MRKLLVAAVFASCAVLSRPAAAEMGARIPAPPTTAAAPLDLSGLPSEIASKFQNADPDASASIRVPMQVGVAKKGSIKAHIGSSCSFHRLKCELHDGGGFITHDLALNAEGKVSGIVALLRSIYAMTRE